MLFQFNYDEKMESNTTTLEMDQQTIPVPTALQQAVHIVDGEEALILLSDGNASVLFKEIIVDTANPQIPLNWESLTTARIEPGESVTYWVTIPDKLDELSFTEGSVLFEDDVEGNALDPTGGSWLLIADREFGYTEAGDRVKGDISIYKSPYREYLNYAGGEQLTVKVVHGDAELEQDVNTYANRKGVTITKDGRRDLGVTEEDRDITAWIDTESIAEAANVTEPTEASESEVKQDGDGAVESGSGRSGGERGVADGSGVSDGFVMGDAGRLDSEAPRAEPTGAAGAGTVGENDRTEQETPEREPGRQIDSTTKPRGETRREPPAQLDVEPDTEPDVNPDFTPVVLLDEDERRNEHWHAHYMQPDGTLLCGKDYVDAVKDPDGKHYSAVCHDCAIVAPGSLPDRDLSLLLSNETGISFTDELPFMIDRRDAARLYVQLTTGHKPD